MTDRTAVTSRASLLERFRRVRATTERLAAPLSAEDQGLQSQPSSSPTKWHRAHTTWFFETFVLEPHGIAPFNARWGALFNSYYETLGPRHPRPRRGMVSRPGAAEVGEYRRTVDARVEQLLARLDERALRAIASTFELGLAHEEQHQELILTDILHALHQNPLQPGYRTGSARAAEGALTAPALRYVPYEAGLLEIGAARDGSFRFDNEEPRHKIFLEPFRLASRLLTVGEWKAFDDARGYETPTLWLSDGWEWVKANEIRAPMYAHRDAGALVVFGLDGVREARDDEPVAHLSFYEADAIARFHAARLPTEAEWEIASTTASLDGNFLEDEALRVLPAHDARGLSQMFGDAWEWTWSPYAPYPGYSAAGGALGEYNGKFMVNQIVLRGGSCFTPRGHVRPAYRNFWAPDTRFQMTGVRLARTGVA